MAKHRGSRLDGSPTPHASNLRAVPAAEVGALLRHHPAGLAVLLDVRARLAPKALRRVTLRRGALATLADGEAVHRERTLDVRRVTVRTLGCDNEVRVGLELGDVPTNRGRNDPLFLVIREDEDRLALCCGKAHARHSVFPFQSVSLAYKYIIPDRARSETHKL